jgi:hypothetical protein
MGTKKNFVIFKLLQNKKGKPQNVLLVNNIGEILEFDDESQANSIASLFEANSEKGYKYYVREI